MNIVFSSLKRQGQEGEFYINLYCGGLVKINHDELKLAINA